MQSSDDGGDDGGRQQPPGGGSPPRRPGLPPPQKKSHKKRKTKATLAREAGLEPFADWIFAIGQGENSDDISLEVKAKEYQNVKKL